MQLPPYDELKHLADHHPQQLEHLRQQLIEQTIGQAPADIQRRLRGLQFRIDAERRRASNPLSACLRLSAMMNDHLCAMLDAIVSEPLPETASESATVIPFPLIAGS